MSSEFCIYVASLSDYNNGSLHGAWLDLEDYSNSDDLQEAVTSMLAGSPYGNSDFAKKHGLHAEEYAIHDYEGFPKGSIGESYTMTDVWKLWEEFEQAKIDDNVEAFTVYCGYFDCDYSAFQERYRGHYDSESAFAEELLEELGELECIRSRGLGRR